MTLTDMKTNNEKRKCKQNRNYHSNAVYNLYILLSTFFYFYFFYYNYYYYYRFLLLLGKNIFEQTIKTIPTAAAAAATEREKGIYIRALFSEWLAGDRKRIEKKWTRVLKNLQWIGNRSKCSIDWRINLGLVLLLSSILIRIHRLDLSVTFKSKFEAKCKIHLELVWKNGMFQFSMNHKTKQDPFIHDPCSQYHTLFIDHPYLCHKNAHWRNGKFHAFKSWLHH